MLERPPVVHPFGVVLARVESAAREEPPPAGGPRGAVFWLEGSVDVEGGFGFAHELSFEATVTCRVRDVPTCTAPLATRYEWTESEAHERDTRDSMYRAEFEDDARGERLIVKVETRKVGRGDPAPEMGLVLLRAGKHAYNKLLDHPMVALGAGPPAPARATPP